VRLHRVRVQAFGPFAEAVEVDLDALAEHGLFLLHGPTGAGKTSLLDAVCFALYGVVPGARAALRGTALRSDHAATGVAPVVEVELTVRGRRLEVVRSPAWDRPKARGTGTTTEQASVRVRERVAAGWLPLATRLDEAGHLLSGLLGMDVRQFTSVVLLPQGDFATFLRAGPDERRTVLERLFGTDRFAAVEQWLAEQRTLTGRAVRAATAQHATLLARADERVAAVREACPGVSAAGGDDAASVRARHDLVADALEAARTQLDQQQETLRRARDAAEAATEVGRRDGVLLETVRRRRRLQAEAAEVDVLRSALAADVRAATLAPHRDRLARADDDLARLRAEVRTALTSLSTSLPEHLQVGDRPDAEALAALLEATRAELARLAPLLQRERAAATLAAEVDAQRDLLAAADAGLRALAAERSALEEDRDDLRARREPLARAAAGLGAAREAVVRAHDVATAAAAAARLAPRLRAADEAVRGADDAAVAARAEHLRLLERRLAGMAGELASSLHDGSPCPVCGAHEHPAPAATGADRVDARVVQAALEDSERLADAARVVRSGRDGLLQQVRDAEQRSGGRSAQAAAAEAEAVTADHTRRRRAGATLARVDAALAAHDEREAELVREVEVLTERSASLREELARLGARRDDLDAQLAAARGADPSVAARQQRLAALEPPLSGALALLREVPVAERVAAEARHDTETACVRAGFTDLTEAAAAALDPSARDDAQARVARHERESAGVEHRLAEDDLAQAAAGVAPEELERSLADRAATHAAVRQHAVEAETAVRATTGRLTLLEGAVVALHALGDEVAAQERTVHRLAAEAQVVEELAGCALGTSAGNALRMRLSAYVLAARLEQVAAAASVRLQATTAGRYELRHCDARGRGGGRSGLGLLVVDHWTGQERETASLSGGESFLASLALALGLADVVQAESGGLAIETLFVDEGFGSLDDDTLELVVASLDELREGGRAVGVVSHLPELRSRIPSQLQVVRGERGSTVRPVHRAG
jgi:exonuclease SbcC